MLALSRRDFVRGVGATAAWIAAREHEALAFGPEGTAAGIAATADSKEILLGSNENPLGPSPAVLDAIRGALGETGARAGRYPFGQFFGIRDVIAKSHGVESENVFVGGGSTQALRNVTELFTDKDKPLVTAVPSYEEPARDARFLGTPVTEVTLDDALRVDLDGLLAASKRAGLVYFCNPNNPTATVHPPAAARDFVRTVSAETSILVDEAYQDYVDDGVRGTSIPFAVETPGVMVARTFSKAYGMAGLRIGYAIGHADAIKKLQDWNGFELFTNFLAMTGAIAALGQDDSVIALERARNEAVRTFTREFFSGAGFEATESQTNFLFVDVNKPIEAFASACKENGVRVGRPFPPLETHARISLGTMEEMERATKVFAKVLGVSANKAA